MSFKKINKKVPLHLRSKLDHHQDDDEEEEEDNRRKKIEELKLIQSLKKKKPAGVNIAQLVSNPKKEPVNVEKNVQTGGLMSSLDLTNTFSAETNRRDEDQEMFKFIEDQLAERKGLVKKDSERNCKNPENPDEIIYSILPQHLLEAGEKKSEEMLSNQMLSGIPEVDLGVEERIRNIEATEEAKMKLIEQRLRRNPKNSSTLVPTNITANYLQNRMSSQQGSQSSKNKPVEKKPPTTVKEPVVVIGDEPRDGYFPAKRGSNRGVLKFPGKEKATDDYHFEKFRKQFRK